MCMWNYIIFLILCHLVPSRQALVENSSAVEPDLSTKLFREIDEYLSELIATHEALLKEDSLCSPNWDSLDYTDRGLTIAPILKTEFNELEKHVHSPNLVRECPNMAENIKEYKNSLSVKPKTNMTNNLTANLNINITGAK